jgi:hypothetical protein
LDSTLTRSGRTWKRHRPSLTAVDEAASPKKRRSAVEKTVEVIYLFGAGCKKECKIHNYKSYTPVCAVFRMAPSHNSINTADGIGCDVSAMFFFISSFDNCPVMPHCMNCALYKAVNQETKFCFIFLLFHRASYLTQSFIVPINA